MISPAQNRCSENSNSGSGDGDDDDNSGDNASDRGWRYWQVP